MAEAELARRPVRLDLDTLAPYLLERHLLAPADVVDSALEIRDYSRRNRSYKVIAPRGESLLVKQAGSPESADFRLALTQEASILRAVATEPILAPLRPYTPRFVHFDADSLVLATELVHPATSVTKYHLNRGQPHFPEDSAVSCARILADFHALGAKALAEGALPDVPERVPFIWDAFRTMDRLQEAGRGVYKVWLLVKERGAFWSRLDALRRDWSDARSLVHLDVRWDNFLLTHGSGPRGMLNLRLIDWELAGRGDASWDVACFLAEYLRFWLQHAAIREGDSPADLPQRQRYPLAASHASSRAFWEAYARRAKLGKAARADLRRRVGQHLPFTMLLVATEMVQASDVVKPNARVAFELALQAAEDPDACLAAWLGLEAGA